MFQLTGHDLVIEGPLVRRLRKTGNHASYSYRCVFSNRNIICTGLNQPSGEEVRHLNLKIVESGETFKSKDSGMW